MVLLRISALFFLCASILPVAHARDQVFPTNAQAHLVAALDVINLTTDDLAFKRDVAKPMHVLPVARRVLKAPLALPPLADLISESLTNGTGASMWQALPAQLLDFHQASGRMKVSPGVLPEVEAPLQEFLRQAALAAAHVDEAFGQISERDRAYLAASVSGGFFGQDINTTSRTAVIAMGVPPDVVDAVIAENLLLDSRPAASNYLALTERIHAARLHYGARLFYDAIDALVVNLEDVTWLESPRKISTYFGDVIIGTHGHDRYAEPAALIIDPAGDDVYSGSAGVANGLKGQSLAGIVDLAGADRYTGTALLGPGVALFGATRILDFTGDDAYAAAYAGQASAAFGVASLDDRAGDDVYRAHGFSQGAAYCGMALLRDAAGDDLYDVGFSGQAYAGVKGVGLLLDSTGDDRYISGGRKHDFDRHDSRYLSMSQGFAIGMRPFAGGGVAALVDLAGNDSYVADVFGQGASYWYAVGILLDGAGHDTYNVYHYGQGCGIHLSAGLLRDGGGNDHYTGYSLTQGNAHDYAVGMLFDHAGNDQYAAHEHSQGRGFFNSFGLLVDSRGHDSYLARMPDQCQGIGHDGHYREYSALGVLLDLHGRDVYGIDVEQGVPFKRPYYGVIYDLE